MNARDDAFDAAMRADIWRDTANHWANGKPQLLSLLRGIEIVAIEQDRVVIRLPQGGTDYFKCGSHVPGVRQDLARSLSAVLGREVKATFQIGDAQASRAMPPAPIRPTPAPPERPNSPKPADHAAPAVDPPDPDLLDGPAPTTGSKSPDPAKAKSPAPATAADPAAAQDPQPEDEAKGTRKRNPRFTMVSEHDVDRIREQLPGSKYLGAFRAWDVLLRESHHARSNSFQMSDEILGDRMCGGSRSVAIQARKNLERIGLLFVHPNERRGGVAFGPTFYTLKPTVNAFLPKKHKD